MGVINVFIAYKVVNMWGKRKLRLWDTVSRLDKPHYHSRFYSSGSCHRTTNFNGRKLNNIILDVSSTDTMTHRKTHIHIDIHASAPIFSFCCTCFNLSTVPMLEHCLFRFVEISWLVCWSNFELVSADLL